MLVPPGVNPGSATTNSLDTVEAFIAVDFVQLVTTKAKCYLHYGLPTTVQLRAAHDPMFTVRCLAGN